MPLAQPEAIAHEQATDNTPLVRDQFHDTLEDELKLAALTGEDSDADGALMFSDT